MLKIPEKVFCKIKRKKKRNKGKQKYEILKK
jgi:hypothetical protein